MQPFLYMSKIFYMIFARWWAMPESNCDNNFDFENVDFENVYNNSYLCIF
jgi:hypothetical protein